MASYAIGAVLAGSMEDPCCCTPPADCCLYPYTSAAPYPDSDLPATITVDGVTFNKVAGYAYEAIGSPEPDMPGKIYVDDLDAQWYLSNSTGEIVFAVSFCLIAPWIRITGEGADTIEVEDEFPDTLTATADDLGPIEITRVSLCEWTGEGEIDGSPFTFRVHYGSEEILLQYQWNWDITLNGEAFGSNPKDDPQDTPIGNYGTWTISA